MHAFAIDIKNLTARSFATTALANSMATEDESVVTRASNLLDDKGCTVIAMTAFYNKFADQLKVAKRNKFDTRAVAAEQVFGVLENLVTINAIEHNNAAAPLPEGHDEVEPAPTKGRKVRGSAATPAAPRAAGQRGAFVGKVLYPTAKVALENPRRHGVAGWYSLEVIRNAPDGISYEAYTVAAGDNAGANHVKWDLEHGNITLEAPVAAAPIKPAKGKGKSKPVAVTE